MSDIRKFLDIINETTASATSSGSVATVAQEMSVPLKRVTQQKKEEKTPKVIEYGNWANSANVTSEEVKNNRDRSAKIIKSIYGEDSVEEASSPQQQAAIAIAKKKKVSESHPDYELSYNDRYKLSREIESPVSKTPHLVAKIATYINKNEPELFKRYGVEFINDKIQEITKTPGIPGDIHTLVLMLKEKLSNEDKDESEESDWSPGTKEIIKQDRIRSLENLISLYKEKGNTKKVEELTAELKSLKSMTEAGKKIPASNKPVKPEDLVVSLKDVPVKKPRGHKQYDPAVEFPGVKAFKKEGVAETSGDKKFDDMISNITKSAGTNRIPDNLWKRIGPINYKGMSLSAEVYGNDDPYSDNAYYIVNVGDKEFRIHDTPDYALISPKNITNQELEAILYLFNKNNYGSLGEKDHYRKVTGPAHHYGGNAPDRMYEQGVAEGSNSSPFDQMANLKSKSNKELDELVKFWQRALEKNPDHKVANDQLHIIKMIRAERIGKKGVAEGKVVGHIGDVAGHGKIVKCAKCGTDLRDDHGYALDNSTYVCRNGDKCSMRQSKNRLDAAAAKGQKPRWRKDEGVTEGSEVQDVYNSKGVFLGTWDGNKLFKDLGRDSIWRDWEAQYGTDWVNDVVMTASDKIKRGIWKLKPSQGVAEGSVSKKKQMAKDKAAKPSKQSNLKEELIDFQTVGDMSRRDYLYRGNQAAWLSSSTQVEKLRQFLSRTPYKFRIFISNQLPTVAYRGEINKAAAIDLVGTEAADKIFSNTGGNITFVKVGNNADPLTPWLITHQLAEMLDNDGKLKRLSRIFYGYLNNIIHKCYGLKPIYKPRNSSLLNPSTAIQTLSNMTDRIPANLANQQKAFNYFFLDPQNSAWVSLIRALLTFRSASNSRRILPEEMYKELIVQYLNTGGEIKLNPLPEKLVTPDGELTLLPNCPDLTSQMKTALVEEITNILNSAVGKVYSATIRFLGGGAKEEQFKRTNRTSIPNKYEKYGLRGFFRENEETLNKFASDDSSDQEVAEAKSPEEFIGHMKNLASTPQKFKVGDWVIIDPNETEGYASSGMEGQIQELYTDDGEEFAKIAVGGASGIQTKMKMHGDVFVPKGTTVRLPGKGVRSSGTHTVVPTSILQKFHSQDMSESKKRIKK